MIPLSLRLLSGRKRARGKFNEKRYQTKVDVVLEALQQQVYASLQLLQPHRHPSLPAHVTASVVLCLTYVMNAHMIGVIFHGCSDAGVPPAPIILSKASPVPLLLLPEQIYRHPSAPFRGLVSLVSHLFSRGRGLLHLGHLT